MRSLVRALSIAVLLVPIAAALPVRALADQSDRQRVVTVPQAIALCQTIYRNVRLGMLVPGYYVPTVSGSGEWNGRDGWLYASRSAGSPPASDMTHPRIRVIWPRRHSVAGHRAPGTVTLRGVLDTRTCVLRARGMVRDVALKHHSTPRHTVI